MNKMLLLIMIVTGIFINISAKKLPNVDHDIYSVFSYDGVDLHLWKCWS